jgi:hypothetical protein
MMLTALVLSLACVEVKTYGKGPEPLGKPETTTDPSIHAPAARPAVDWLALEEQLSELLIEETDADRKARLSAAHGMASDMRRGVRHPDKVVEAYLLALVDIEERNRPEELPVLGDSDGFRIGESVQIELIEEPLDIESARAALAEGRYRDAVDLLAPHRDEPEVQRIWTESVDGWCHAERERAGKLFVRAREMPAGDVQSSAYAEVERILSGLLEEFPENSYAGAIQKNLEMVRKEM